MSPHHTKTELNGVLRDGTPPHDHTHTQIWLRITWIAATKEMNAPAVQCYLHVISLVAHHLGKVTARRQERNQRDDATAV